MSKGCYWMYDNFGGKIYWSNSDMNIKNDIEFANEKHFFEHREKIGYPKNWSLIKKINVDNIVKHCNLFGANSSGDNYHRNLWINGAVSFIPQVNELVKYLNYEPIFYDTSHFDNEYSNELCDIFKKNRSDKSNSGFYPVYSYILNKLNRDSELNICEIGLGTNNTTIISWMTSHFKPGSSLYSFRDFLPNSNIYGADIDRDILFSDDRIKTCYVDQLDKNSFNNLIESFGDINYDLFIDDGLHSISANFNTLLFAIEKIKKNGWIVIEDIHIIQNWYGIDYMLKQNGYNTYFVKAVKNYLYCINKV